MAKQTNRPISMEGVIGRRQRGSKMGMDKKTGRTSKKKAKSGFTIMEMLIVVAIIAVLVAIAIPTFNGSLHKAKVAADWANLRAFYAEIQLDYMTSGEYNEKIPVDWHTNSNYDWKSVTFLNGDKVEMTAGICAVSFNDGAGYSIEYDCNSSHAKCHLSLPVK